MKVFCAICERYMGEIEGKLRKGWVILCEGCHDRQEDHHKGDMPDFLKDLFKGHK